MIHHIRYKETEEEKYFPLKITISVSPNCRHWLATHVLHAIFVTLTSLLFSATFASFTIVRTDVRINILEGKDAQTGTK